MKSSCARLMMGNNVRLPQRRKIFCRSVERIYWTNIASSFETECSQEIRKTTCRARRQTVRASSLSRRRAFSAAASAVWSAILMRANHVATNFMATSRAAQPMESQKPTQRDTLLQSVRTVMCTLKKMRAVTQ
jgi:hypothetical protein